MKMMKIIMMMITWYMVMEFQQTAGAVTWEYAFILEHILLYLLHFKARAYCMERSRHCLNSASLPGTAAKPQESPTEMVDQLKS